jgi:hypothetical protein
MLEHQPNHSAPEEQSAKRLARPDLSAAAERFATLRAEAERVLAGPRFRFKTGFPALDAALPGLRPGWLGMVAGRARRQTLNTLADAFVSQGAIVYSYGRASAAEIERSLEDCCTADVVIAGDLGNEADLESLFQTAKRHDVLLLVSGEGEEGRLEHLRGGARHVDYCDLIFDAFPTGEEQLELRLLKNRYGPTASAEAEIVTDTDGSSRLQPR